MPTIFSPVISSLRVLIPISHLSQPISFDLALLIISLSPIYELALAMEQHQEQTLENPFHYLDGASKETTTAFARAHIRHGYIGGYATSLVGGKRTTSNLDVLIDADPNNARNLLLQAHPGFTLTQSNKLVFVSGDKSTEVVLNS
ncbi:hypothetical protein N7523_000786 [Penicillium sp. IBT 18751x]|nr:hypothetical protein N7523_000786 [Penicillium sp. IBT 18751x]